MAAQAAILGTAAVSRRERRAAWDHLGRPCELAWIAASDLRRDREYNREIRPDKVAAIRRKFHADGLGVIIVSLREDGLHYIIDGQHRHESVMTLNMGHRKLPCIVYTGLTREQERLIFLMLNRERLPLSAMEAFEARAAAGENLAGAVKELLDRHGIRLVRGRQPGVREIASVGALEEIDARWGDAMVARVLALFGRAWPEQPGIYQRPLLMAAAAVLADPATDDARFARALAACTPAELQRIVLAGLQRASYSGWSKYADAMRARYAGTK